MNPNSAPAVAGDQAISHSDSDELSWQEVKELGIDPAPAGLAEDDQSPQS